MKTVTLALVLLDASCGAVIRDPRRFREDVQSLGHAVVASTEGPLAYAAMLARGGDMERCTAIVANTLPYRMMAPWVVQVVLNNGGQADDPGPGPVIPTAAEWCMERHLAANDPSQNPPAPPEVRP